MGSAAPPPEGQFDRKGVRRMLTIFGVLAVAGVLTFAVSRILGLVLLAIAEVFFVIAYRRFSGSAKKTS